MHATYYLLSLLSNFLLLTTASPIAGSTDLGTSPLQKRDANWCTLHYAQGSSYSKLTVFGPKTDPNAHAPQLGFFTNGYPNGAYTPLPGYGDTLIAVNNPDQSVTFMGLGGLIKSWTIMKGDQGTVGGCSVGAWERGTSRTMDYGFTCNSIPLA